MAYNAGYPVGYPYYQQPIMPTQPVQMYPQQYQQTTPTQQQSTVMQGGFVRIPSENDARMYPVAPGNSVTFIDENKLYIYTKTVNMGQLDRPIFEKYRLVKEDDGTQPTDAANNPSEAPTMDMSKYALASDIESIKADIEIMRSDIYGIAGKKKTSVTKKEVVTDE